VLKVRVRAAAERGKANLAAAKIVADAIKMPPESVRVVTGHTAPRKIIEILGMSESEVHSRLGKVAR